MTDVAIAPTPITQRQHEWLAARLVELDAVLRSLNALRYWSVPGCDAVQTPLEAAATLARTSDQLPAAAWFDALCAALRDAQGFWLVTWTHYFTHIDQAVIDERYAEFMDHEDPRRAAYTAKLRAIADRHRAWLSVSAGDVARRTGDDLA